jgi:stress response protein SCP2
LSFDRNVSCITAMLLGEFVDRTRPWSFANLGVGTFGGVIYVVEVLVTLVGLFRGACVVLVGSGIL